MVVARTPWWTWIWPLLAWAVLLLTVFVGASGLMAAAAGAVLIATVFAAVYHAEVVAHRIGEPFGTLVLAVAVTVIEVALIVSVMAAAPAEKVGLARDTVFAAVMIVCNGIVGLCLLAGGARHHEQGFQIHGASAALAVLAALTTLTLILPNATTSTPGPAFSTSPAALRWNGLAGALRLVCLRPDRATPRLFSCNRGRERRGACATAVRQDRRRQPRPAAGGPGGRRGTGEIPHADAGDRRCQARRAEGRRRHRHRSAGVAAGRSGRSAGPRVPTDCRPA